MDASSRTRAVHAGLSVMIAFTLVGVVVANLPDSHLRRQLAQVTQPYLNAVGLDQNWGVFAPDPRRESIGFKARIVYPSSEGTWTPPDRDPVIGTYSDYRWRKYIENLTGNQKQLAEPLARWLAQERASLPQPPASITLVKRTADLQPPGRRPAQGPYRESSFFTHTVTSGELEGGAP